jgi:hypothetical protein
MLVEIPAIFLLTSFPRLSTAEWLVKRESIVIFKSFGESKNGFPLPRE